MKQEKLQKPRASESLTHKPHATRAGDDSGYVLFIATDFVKWRF